MGNTYRALLRFLTCVEHAIDLTEARLSRKGVLHKALIHPINELGLQIIEAPCWQSENGALSLAWKKGVRLVPFLSVDSSKFAVVSAQKELLNLLYLLGGVTASFIESESFANEKKKLMVTIRPLDDLSKNIGIDSVDVNELISSINQKLDGVNSVAALNGSQLMATDLDS